MNPNLHRRRSLMQDLKEAGLPVLTDAELHLLEQRFPPRCLGTAETVEQHLRYAGKVELVEALKAARVASKAVVSGEDGDAEVDAAIERLMNL